MVGQLDIKGLGEHLERPGESDIRKAWPGVAGRMIVNQQQRCRTIVQGPLHKEPVAALDPVVPADGYNFVANIGASAIQKDHD